MMPPIPGPDPQFRPDEEFHKLVQRANQSRNGSGPPMLPPGVKPRPSGYRCSRCGEMAEQKVIPDPATIIGYRFLLNADVPQMLGHDADRPNPVSVIAPEILERDSEGNPIKTYVTVHCFNCFNTWQRRKMMEDLRANVPVLVFEGVPEDA